MINYCKYIEGKEALQKASIKDILDKLPDDIKKIKLVLNEMNKSSNPNGDYAHKSKEIDRWLKELNRMEREEVGQYKESYYRFQE